MTLQPESPGLYSAFLEEKAHARHPGSDHSHPSRRYRLRSAPEKPEGTAHRSRREHEEERRGGAEPRRAQADGPPRDEGGGARAQATARTAHQRADRGAERARGL